MTKQDIYETLKEQFTLKDGSKKEEERVRQQIIGALKALIALGILNADDVYEFICDLVQIF